MVVYCHYLGSGSDVDYVRYIINDDVDDDDDGNDDDDDDDEELVCLIGVVFDSL